MGTATKETWDDPERSPENRRSGTAELRPAQRLAENYIWRLLLLNRRNGHGGNPKPDRTKEQRLREREWLGPAARPPW